MKVLKGLGILIAIILIYLIIVIIFPVLNIEKQPFQLKSDASEIPLCRKDIFFTVDSIKVKGWLYLPEDTISTVPCIILTNGFCGTKDMLLEKYALRFVEAGFTTLSFDYRHFGDSEGEPRQLFSITKQLEDIHAAIEFARRQKEIDPEKIFIWGTSSAGNYGIMIAAEDEKIAGVVGQTPSLDPEADGKRIVDREGIGWMLKLIVHAQRDKGRSRFGLPPHIIPAIGKPGTTAMHRAPGFFEGYQKIAENSQMFRNEVCARIMFESHGPDIFEAAAKVKCPVLFHICEKDINIAPNSHKKIEKILKDKVKIVKYPIGHFDIYFGEHFEKCINDQIAFLKNNL